MTGIELVRKVLPDASEEDCDRLLWGCTAFPFSKDPRKLKRQIRVAWEKGGKTVDGALGWVLSEIDRRLQAAR